MNRTSFTQRLELRQSQALIMTPQLQQAIKMLQLSNLELTNFIDGEIQQNPLLERRERELGENTQGDHTSGGEDASSTAVPKMLTGEFAPDAAEQWQPEWGEDGDRAVDFGGEPQPWHSRNQPQRTKPCLPRPVLTSPFQTSLTQSLFSKMG